MDGVANTLDRCPDTPLGDYILTAGLYLPSDDVRVPILDETGQPVSNSIRLATLTVQ